MRLDDSPRSGCGAPQRTRAARRPGPWAEFGVLAAVVLCAGVWQAGGAWSDRRLALAAFPTTSGAIQLPGLSGRVELLRDPRGVPHIDATNEADGWSVLGFAHAQDRLAQMFWLRRLARGRTAEVVGERGLATDRLARTLAIGAHADAEALRLDPDTREVLMAYASGVNSRIERIRAGIVEPPFEMAGSADRTDLSEPWTPGDSLAVVKLMAWSAGPSAETASVLWDLIDELGVVAARPFMPTGLGVRGVDLTAALPPSARPGAASGVESTGAVPRPHSTDPASSRLGPLFSGSTGGTALADARLDSTASVVSGRLTRSGHPILTVDFHLPPTVPTLVYEAQIRAGGLDLKGVTVPGAPVFWAGRNRHLAWAATPGRIVTADLYRETLNPDDPSEYRHGRSWLKIQQRDETIQIGGTGRPVREEILRVRETHHGPIVNELIGRAGDPLALAWTGALPGNGVVAMLGVARAADEQELRSALRDHHEPAIALLYADDSGAAGLQVAGWIPRRRLHTGHVPVLGRHTVFDWRSPIKAEDLPHMRLAAEDDWLIASDAPLVDGLGGRIEWLWRTGDAAARLDSRLRAISQTSGPLEMEHLAALSPERWFLRSPEAVSALLQLAGDPEQLAPEAREAADILSAWDGTFSAGSSGAAAVHLVFHHLTLELFSGPVGPVRWSNYLALSHTRPQMVSEQVVLAALRSSGGPGWSEPERVRTAVVASLQAAWMSLSLRFGEDRERWRWDGLARLAYRPFAHEGAFGRIADDMRRQLREIERAAPVAAMNSTDPFEVQAITSYRLVVDLASPDRALSALVPGQSEHPYHPHFADGRAELLEGRWPPPESNRLPSDLSGGTLRTSNTSKTDEIRAERLILEPVERAESVLTAQTAP